MNKQRQAILAVVIISLIVIGWAIFIKNGNHGQRVCPEAWYDNQMPGTVGDNPAPRQYFVVGGERVELGELDVAWIRHNCSVNKPQVVQ